MSDILLLKSTEISESLTKKAQVLLSLIVKPKTIQNRLRKNELYQKKIKILDLAVKSIWK